MNIFTINQLYWRKNPTHSFVVLLGTGFIYLLFLTINLGKYVFEKSDFLVAVLNSFTVYQLHFLCRHQGLMIGVKVEMASSEKVGWGRYSCLPNGRQVFLQSKLCDLWSKVGDSYPEIEVKAKIAKVDQGKFHLCSDILFTFIREERVRGFKPMVKIVLCRKYYFSSVIIRPFFQL